MIRFLSLLCLISFLNAGFTGPRPEKKIKLPKSFVYIPSGEYSDVQQHFAMTGFYMMSGEVTNLDYKEFLYYLKANGREAEYAKADVHAEGWGAVNTVDPQMAQDYYQFQAYNEYPVVNITQEAARMYCQWLTGILQSKYPDFKIEVRLPTEKEWMYAAQGGIQSAAYPNGDDLRNTKGEYLYNFKAFGDESIHKDPVTGKLVIQPVRKSNDGAQKGHYGPTPATVFTPNAYGLFNISGNVAEMLSEEGRTKGGSFNSTGFDIRIDAPDSYAGFKESSPFIGFRPLLTVVNR